MTSPATIRDKLERLDELDPDAAREVRDCWPLTLHGLDEAAGEPLLASTHGQMRENLERELDELTAEATAP